MKFADIKQRIDLFFSEEEDRQFFSDDEQEIMKGSFELITKDIHRMIDGDNLEHNNETYLKVVDCIVILSNKTLNGPLSDSMVSVIESYSELIFNWNQNISGDAVIRQLCLHISRITETRTSLLENITVMKGFDERMALLSSWSPPAYEISKAYFEELLKENEKEKV